MEEVVSDETHSSIFLSKNIEALTKEFLFVNWCIYESSSYIISYEGIITSNSTAENKLDQLQSIILKLITDAALTFLNIKLLPIKHKIIHGLL